MGCANAKQAEKPKERFHDKYVLGSKIGQGAFGHVCAVRRRQPQRAEDDSPVSPGVIMEDSVVKVMYLQKKNTAGIDRELKKNARKEHEIWAKVGKNQHCVELFEAFCENGTYFMVMEKCVCDFSKKLNRMHSATDADMSKIFRQMLLGIGHLHSRGIVHRDIKPDNFLFGGKGGTQVKICDFGLSAELPPTGQLKGVYGTAPYMSPEMLMEPFYSEKTDVWSFAITAYVILFAAFPYGGKVRTAPEMKDAIRVGKPPNFDNCPLGHLVTHFLKTIWCRDPRRRMSIEQVLELSFVQPQQALTPSTDFVSMKPAADTVKKAAEQFNQENDKGVKKDPKQLNELLKSLRSAGSKASSHKSNKGVEEIPVDDDAEVDSDEEDNNSAMCLSVESVESAVSKNTGAGKSPASASTADQATQGGNRQGNHTDSSGDTSMGNWSVASDEEGAEAPALRTAPQALPPRSARMPTQT